MLFLIQFILFALCCTFTLSDDSQDQALKALAGLTAAGNRRSYGGGNAYGGQYQPIPIQSYGYQQPQVIIPQKGTKAKGWTKHIFKSSNKAASSSYPSYVIGPYGGPSNIGGSAYASRFGDYPNGYNNGYSRSYGSSYAPAYVPPYNNAPYVPPYQPPFAAGAGGFNFYPVQPPLVGSSLYGSPAYGSFYGLNYNGNFGGNFGAGGFGAGYQSYTPTLVGAFDNYRGPIYYGGFRPTLGPYGGKPFSDLLSVTDSYGRPLFPYPSTANLFAKKSDS